MKDFHRRGIDMEPFFMSSKLHTFRVNTFYAEIVGSYDDGITDDALRPWRLRQMQDQNGGKRQAWDSTLKLQELDEQISGREMPKRVIFDLLMDLGALSKPNDAQHAKSQRASHWRIHVKGYALITEATKDMPVRVSSYGQENPADIYEVMAYQHMYDTKTMERVPAPEVTNAYTICENPDGPAQVILSDEEVKQLRTFGCIPGIKLLGFKQRSTLHFVDNIKHAYFLYPSDMEHTGSKRTFAALLNSMLSKEVYALALYMPRENVIPAFVAILPQAEEVDADGNQLVPPGMNMVILPYTDDLRDPPTNQAEHAANADQISKAGQIIDQYLRKAPFNPDAYTNPALQHHYQTLMAVAFNQEKPAYQDTVLPDYALIDQRAGSLIHAWNESIDADPRTRPVSPPAKRTSQVVSTVWSTEREQEIHNMHQQGLLGRYLVAELRDVCAHYELPTTGRKSDLVDRLQNFLSTS